MKRALVWREDGGDWPNREHSRFVAAGGLHWHVQVMGSEEKPGPVLLLLHGTGGSTHSWRDLAPLLASCFTVVAPDLPGHGFTDLPSHRTLTLPGMAEAVGALMAKLELAPALLVGHSAGAAVALRAVLDRRLPAAPVISINGALTPFPGLASRLFPALAKAIFVNPFAAGFLALRAGDPAITERLITRMGSHIDRKGLDLYRRLFRSTRHVEAALGMMASWDLWSLQRDLARLESPLLQLVAEGDLAVPSNLALETQRQVPGSTVQRVPKLGHLAHEEAPEDFDRWIRQACLTFPDPITCPA